MSLVDIAPLYPNTQQTVLLSADLLNLYTLMRVSMREHDHTGGNNGPLLTSSALSWPLRAPDGSVSSPSLSWSGTDDDDSGWYRIGQNNLGLSMDGTKVWDITNTSFTLSQDLLFTDATYDIGKSGATRPRDGFFSRNVTIGGTLGITGTTTAAAINMSGVLTSTNVTDATSINSGSIITDGGVGIEKALWVGGLANIAGAITGQSTLTLTGALIGASTNTDIRTNTADASDNANLRLTGGGAIDVARGGFIIVSGNEHALAGSIVLAAGNVAGGELLFRTANEQTRLTISNSGAATFAGAVTLQSTLTVSGTGTSTINANQVDFSTNQNAQSLWRFLNTNTNASAESKVFVYVNGSGAADPNLEFTVAGVQSWTMGIDNSDSDKFKIHTGSSLSSTPAIAIDTSSNVSLGAALAVTGTSTLTGAVTIQAASTFALDINNARTGDIVGVRIGNTNNSDGSSHAQLAIAAGGASGGDARISFVVSGVGSPWYIGLDNSDSDAFLFSYGTGLGNGNVLRIDSGGSAGQTVLSIYDVDNGALERVTVGVADSGGAGYKVLRIPN